MTTNEFGSPGWAEPPRFDPTAGVVVREAPGNGTGYWAGAPGVFHDTVGGDFYLTYRVRRPRGAHPDRGAETFVARGSDGVHFENIWSGAKEQFNSASIERCAIRRLDQKRWVLYVSYVDPVDARWRIDAIESDSPANFDPQQARGVFTAGELEVEGVKDPYVFRFGGRFWMIASFATTAVKSTQAELHGSSDAYNTGRIRSATGAAVSDDGLEWTWCGEVFGPLAGDETAWDRYCARVGCLLRLDAAWIALYDGSASVEENYEERLGVAVGRDLRSLQRSAPRQPWMTTPQTHGALRYFDALQFSDRTLIYYEMAEPGGEHHLRVIEL